MIVSYGGHGGGKAAGQLKQVLQGVRMRPTERMVGLTFPGKEFLVKAAKGEELGLGAEGEEGVWGKEQQEIGGAFEELIGLLGA
jgi:NAD(P)H-dependent FMN reductase